MIRLPGTDTLRAWLETRLDTWREPAGTQHVAFGTFCHIAAALREAGLRRATGPFDWIFSTPAMLQACLADDFAALLDPAQLASVPAAERTNGAKRQCRHRLYEATFPLPVLFNHHDPAQSAADRASFERAIARFRKALAGPRPLTLWMMSERDWPEPEIEDLLRQLGREAAPIRLIMLTLRTGPERRWEIERRADDGRRLDLAVTVLSRSTGARFADPEDDAYLQRVLVDVAGPSGPKLSP